MTMEQKCIISEQSRNELDKNTVDFYLNEAERQLEGIVDVSNRITDRSYILLTGIITVLTGFGWILNMQEGNISLVNIYHWYIGFCCGFGYFDIENYMYSYYLVVW